MLPDRVGPVVDWRSTPPDLLDALRASAASVAIAGFEFKAPSASAAAAWLLACADANAFGSSIARTADSIPSLQPFYQGNWILGFRGQPEKYPTIIPSRNHVGVSAEERSRHNVACTLFGTAVSAWYCSNFKHLDGSRDGFGLASETAVGLAQHYRIRTFMTDWSWDPLVSLAFAIRDRPAGERGAVYVRRFLGEFEPADNYLVHLAPTFAQRVWRQRGFFNLDPVVEDADVPIVRLIAGDLIKAKRDARGHFRVTFPISVHDLDWAAQYLEPLEEDDLELEALAGWALSAASMLRGKRMPFLSPRNIAAFQEDCERAGIPCPEMERLRSVTRKESVVDILDYIDAAAVRRHPTRGYLCYYIPATMVVAVGLPFSTWWRPHCTGGLSDPRARPFSVNPFTWQGRLDWFNICAANFGAEPRTFQEGLTRRLFVRRPNGYGPAKTAP